MSIAHYEPRCAKCLRPSEYNSPDWLCRFHWVEWAVEILEIEDEQEVEIEKQALLLDILIDYGPPPEYWYHKLIREMESHINEKSSKDKHSK